ncbi:MAG: InlB B-repeat-containing protein [Treponema sp.]|nr:InlB B-repeat-containing protein [Treponema sp.]
MKKAFRFLAVVFLAFAFIFVSCQDLVSGSIENGTQANNNTVLKIRFAGNTPAARTALPEADEVVFTSFALEGVPTDSSYKTVNWQSTTGVTDAKGELTTAEIAVTKGISYNFTLTATTSGDAVYKDTKAITIQEGANTLSFSLTLVNVGTGTGNAVISVTIPSEQSGQGEVKKLTVSVYKVNIDGTLVSSPVSDALTEKELPLSGNLASLDTGSLEPGAYCAVFKLWGGVDSTAILGTWREYFGIVGGLTSKGTINPTGTEKAVDQVYTITYHSNDTAEEPATITAPRSFSRTSVVTIDAIKALSFRVGCKIEGWYTDEACTQAFTTTDGVTNDIDLYAKWNEAYKVVFTDSSSEHGTPSADNMMQLAGQDVTISVATQSGWAVKTVTVTAVDADGNDLASQPTGFPKTMSRTDSKTFTMPAGLPYHGGVKADVEYQRGYTITVVAGISNGTVTPSETFVTETEVQSGKTITLTMKPTLNYKLTSLEATKDTDSSEVTLSTENQYNRYTRTFTMPASDVTVTAEFADTIKMTESVVSSGGYYLFGDYPQSSKNNAVSVWTDRSKTNGELTYIQGTDDAFYVAVSGSYYRVEPVKWKRLTTNYGGKSLLHAAVILTARRFDDDSNNYAASEIRSWLNNGFINTAFTAAARGNIATTTVDNSAASTNPALHPKQWNSGNNQYACANTSDKIFLLSENEATTSAYGFADYGVYDSARHRKPTDYAKAKGAFVVTSGDYAGNGWWWLRSPNYNDRGYARGVYDRGDAYINYYVDYYNAGIVPALSISF